jgi:hypothetical protein
MWEKSLTTQNIAFKGGALGDFKKKRREEKRREVPEVSLVAFIPLFLAASESGSDSILYARGIYGFPNLLSILVAKI